MQLTEIKPHYYLHQGGDMHLSVCLTARLPACFQNNLKSYEQILMTFSGNVDNGPRNRWLNFDDVLLGFCLLILPIDLVSSFVYVAQKLTVLQKTNQLFLKLFCTALHLRPTAVWRWDGESHDWIWNTHTREERKGNPLMGEMREVVGSVTAWLKHEGHE